MRIHDEEIRVRTARRFELVDVTEDVARAAAGSGLREGIALVHVPHTTAAVRINESDARLHQDMERFLAELSPPAGPYRHDLKTVDDRPNAWGHLMSLLMGSSVLVPLREGRLDLGTWQRVFFVELDGPREGRTVKVRVLGE